MKILRAMNDARKEEIIPMMLIKNLCNEKEEIPLIYQNSSTKRKFLKVPVI